MSAPLTIQPHILLLPGEPARGARSRRERKVELPVLGAADEEGPLCAGWPLGGRHPNPLHSYHSPLAFCDMKTLYLRNVPDDVSSRLAFLAAREGLSVSSFALRELTEAARRADNPALLGELPDLDVSPADVIAELESARSVR